MTSFNLPINKVAGLLLVAGISTLLTQVAYNFGEKGFTTVGQILIAIWIGWEIWGYHTREHTIDRGTFWLPGLLLLTSWIVPGFFWRFTAAMLIIPGTMYCLARAAWEVFVFLVKSSFYSPK